MSDIKLPEDDELRVLTSDAIDIVASYARCFATRDGQIVMDDLREKFMDRSSIVLNDPFMTHANEGAREVFLYIQENMKDANK